MARFNLNEIAQLELRAILAVAQKTPGLAQVVRKKPWYVSLVLNNEAAMKKANLKYQGKNYATDILSFPAPEVFREKGILGDLMICKDTLRKQALELDHPVVVELRVLLVHGVLHLLELDHEKGAKAAREMASFEKLLLKNVGAAKSLIERAHSGTKKR